MMLKKELSRNEMDAIAHETIEKICTKEWANRNFPIAIREFAGMLDLDADDDEVIASIYAFALSMVNFGMELENPSDITKDLK